MKSGVYYSCIPVSTLYFVFYKQKVNFPPASFIFLFMVGNDKFDLYYKCLIYKILQ